MKKFTEQLKKQAAGIKLRTDERRELRERVLSYMEYHPLPEGQSVSLRRLAKPRRHLVFINGWMIGRALGASLAFFLIIVPALAEKALPGEILYPVKLRFNEELRGALVSTPYEKIEWETERLERRLAEASLLADAGRLTPAAEADVARAIKEHSAAAQASIADIRASDNEEAALAEITLASALEVQSEVLGKRDQTSGANSVSALASAVNAARLNVVTPDGEKISYRKLQERIENETTRAYEYFNSLNGVVSPGEKADIERRLTDVKAKMEAAGAIHNDDEETSVRILTDALSSTRKLISFMTNIDVRKNVKIEDIVPVTPTEDEKRIELVQLKLIESDQLILKVNTGISQLATTSSNYLELSEGVIEYGELHDSASTSLAAADLAEAEKTAASAWELANGLLNHLKALGLQLETSTATSSAPR